MIFILFLVPLPPTNIKVEEEISKTQPANFNENNIFYDVIVSWTPPKLLPSYYVINITDSNTSAILTTQNIYGVLHFLFFFCFHIVLKHRNKL